MKAKYLIRIDDICENLNVKNFHKLIGILNSFNVKPIIAVIPNNKDKSLKFKDSISGQTFWDLIYKLETEDKWKVGIHGYDHDYVNNNSGKLDINSFSEFAGVEYDTQLLKIENSLKIMREHKLSTDLFIAPAHSFDDNTLKILKKLNINSISDGFHKLPGLDKNGVFWIPQQLWSFSEKQSGIWTVNFHINHWNVKDFIKLEKNLTKYLNNIVDYNYIKNIYFKRKLNVQDHFMNLYSIKKNKIISSLVKIKNKLL